MAKWISGINIHPPIPTLQKLFTSRPTQIPQLRGHLQDEAHHLKSHSQPVPQRACPQPTNPDSSKTLHPSPPPRQTGLQRDRAGASIGSKHPIPTARQRDSPTSRTIPASAGPVPRSHLQEEAHHLKSHSQPVPQRACPQPNPPDSAKALYLTPHPDTPAARPPPRRSTPPEVPTRSQ